jgi:hypothetical protein
MPEPNPHVHEHVHKHDEITLYIGCDPQNPEALGAEIEFCAGGKSMTVNATSVLFMPAGVHHGPVVWRSVTKPHLEMEIQLGTGSCRQSRPTARLTKHKEELFHKTIDGASDKNQENEYMLKPILMENRSGQPAMIRVTDSRAPSVSSYIEFGWIHGMPGPNPYFTEATHAFDEVVLHWGVDPENPLDLGAEIACFVGGQPMTIDTTSALWAPKGLSHGPFVWKKIRRPHVRMTLRPHVAEMDEMQKSR